MLFWSSAALVAAKMDRMKAAEAKLVEFARTFGNRDAKEYEMELFDSPIPASVIPLEKHHVAASLSCRASSCEDETTKHDEELSIHGIRVISKTENKDSVKTPLVIQHGYMNGCLYFYRNLVGLSAHFQTVYAIDMLGWGLSSRPAFKLRDKSTETTEEFFVESLEAWRAKNKIEKMILAGHSIGGYLSVAYTEKYPERVERLILLSPAGVPMESEQAARLQETASVKQRLFLALYSRLFESGTTPCSVLRTLPKKKAYEYTSSYVQKRLPAIRNPEEQAAVADYLYFNSVLPPSGERCLNSILQPNVLAKKPLVNRIPNLKVSSVSFLYGATDWMEYTGGLETKARCQQRQTEGNAAPNVEVFRVQDAGHLLMLDNWAEVNGGIVASIKGKDALAPHEPLPELLSTSMDQKQASFEQFELTKASARPASRSVEVQA